MVGRGGGTSSSPKFSAAQRAVLWSCAARSFSWLTQAAPYKVQVQANFESVCVALLGLGADKSESAEEAKRNFWRLGRTALLAAR